MALRLLAEANLAFGISITDLDEFLPEAQKVADRWADRLWYHLGQHDLDLRLLPRKPSKWNTIGCVHIQDHEVDWDEHDGIKSAVTGLLSSGLSGFSLEHSDIGGYTAIDHPLLKYHRSKELLMRWTELAAFTTVFRTHEGNRPKVNHQIYSDEETLRHFSRFAKVYTAWKPYRIELVKEASETGLPVVRHPFVHYPDDPEVLGLDYQFMVGRNLMVAPVLDPGEEIVEVYFPAGRWVHLWSGRKYGSLGKGVYETVHAPVGKPAMFYEDSSDVNERAENHCLKACTVSLRLLVPPTNSSPAYRYRTLPATVSEWVHRRGWMGMRGSILPRRRPSQRLCPLLVLSSPSRSTRFSRPQILPQCNTSLSFPATLSQEPEVEVAVA